MLSFQLQRKDFLIHITKTISIKRLQKEMQKISSLLIPEETVNQVKVIERLLTDFESELLVDVGVENHTFPDVQTEVDNIDRLRIDNLFIDRMNKLQISPKSSTSSKCNDESNDVVDIFHECWINLEGENLEIFNALEVKLLSYKKKDQIQSALNFLRATISDFPPEFYLQPPNILEILIDVLPNVALKNSIEIIELIHFIIKGLKDRDLEARKNQLSFIPVKKYMNRILQMLTNFFERFHDNFDAARLPHQQEILNSIHLVLFDVADFVKETQNVCDIYLNELMNMISKAARDFREAYAKAKDNSALYRVNYIVELYLINAFVSVIDVDNILTYCENNIWEYECDLALLDWPLRSHVEIFNLIKSNRNDIIADDNDMKLLICDIKKTWTPIANLFRNWKSMPDEDVIMSGLKCVDIIRILRSSELVEVLLKAIDRCSSRFNTNNHIKEAAEEIFLRLLSIEILEVKLKTYALARESIQKRLSDDQDEKLKDSDLCFVIGIPISTEIITEILCFGYSNENTEICNHAKIILFALLRAKIVFPNHWTQLLQFIKPVLPLAPGLFKTDQKLGFFAFDIFHEHSGFDKHELNRAFIRFLFCEHPKAREMAKIKLLENLNVNEYTSEFIEIVPNDFCILPDEKITKIDLMNPNLGYDQETYQKIKDVLQTCKHEDAKIIKTVLLQLNSLMNSMKFCQKSHDDNLWIHLILTLDMGFPNNFDIRRLVISILSKWAVTVSSFRIYLANEPTVMRFIINTLVYCQDDFAIKKLASFLLFMLSFS